MVFFGFGFCSFLLPVFCAPGADSHICCSSAWPTSKIWAESQGLVTCNQRGKSLISLHCFIWVKVYMASRAKRTHLSTPLSAFEIQLMCDSGLLVTRWDDPGTPIDMVSSYVSSRAFHLSPTPSDFHLSFKPQSVWFLPFFSSCSRSCQFLWFIAVPCPVPTSFFFVIALLFDFSLLFIFPFGLSLCLCLRTAATIYGS